MIRLILVVSNTVNVHSDASVFLDNRQFLLGRAGDLTIPKSIRVLSPCIAWKQWKVTIPERSSLFQ